MPKISLSGPADLLTVLPYHLGFRPERSVVVACFHGRRLGLVARLDLVAPPDAAAAAAQILPALVRERPSRVVLVGFAGGAADEDPAPLLTALGDALEAELVPVGDRLVVREGRWFGLDCACCPPPGRALPDVADVPAVAEYVALGTVVLGTRQQLAALVEPLPTQDPRHDDRLAAVEAWAERYAPSDVGTGVADRRARAALVDEALGAWVRLVRRGLGTEPTPTTLAALLGPLVDVRLRDLLVAWLCPGTLSLEACPRDLVSRLRRALEADTSSHESMLRDVREVVDGEIEEDIEQDIDEDIEEDIDEMLEGSGGWDRAVTERVRLARLEELCRATPAACAAPVLAVVAAYAWWLGDGAHASVAVDRALEVDPRYRLAQLVRQSLDRGLRPRSCA
jgi:hypothetical protein